MLYQTRDSAVAERNRLLDLTLFAFAPDFEQRYTHTSQENVMRYRRQLYAVIDAVQEWPAEIVWPEPPELETQEAFAARIAAEIPEYCPELWASVKAQVEASKE